MSKAILIVDDDLAVLRSLEKLFKKEGYEVTCVSSGKEALARVERFDFDLVIIDIRMPELDGIETVKSIKEIQKNKFKPDIPVIFITGYTDIDANEIAKKLGDVVLKPFDLEDLLNRVRQQSTKRRVGITGIGVIAPNGIGKEEFCL
mgnify:CR=1 FL=1